jgi:MFS family permease
MVWASTPLMLGVFFAIMGTFSACTDATQRSYVARSVPEYERGTAYGLLNGAIGFGAMFSGIIGGLIWQNLGAEYALVVSGFIVLIGLGIFWTSKRVG